MQSPVAPPARLLHDRRTGTPRARHLNPPGAAAIATRGVLVFVDPRRADLMHLAASPVMQAGIVPLDPEGDGLQQIAAVLAVTPGVRAAVLAVHSLAGQVALGDALLSATTLPSHAVALRNIGRALGPQGVMLLYGCAAADDPSFVADMAMFTRIQVVALPDMLLAAGLAALATPMPVCGWSG